MTRAGMTSVDPLICYVVVVVCISVLVHCAFSKCGTSTVEVRHALQRLRLMSKSDATSLPSSSSEDEVRKRIQDKQQHWLKAVLTVWSAITQVYLLLSFLAQNYFAFGAIMQLPNFMTCAAANLVFKELRRPDIPLTPECMRCFTIMMTGATLVFTVGLPRELLPAGYIARITICALSGNAAFATKVNVVMGPFFVLSHYLQTDIEPSRSCSHLMFMLVNELIAISLMAMAVSTLDSKEYQIELAAVQLEHKVSQLQEAEVSGYAAKRLLSVTCDAIVRLSDELTVAESGRSLADLLMCGLGFKNNSLEGVSFLRYVAVHDHGRLKEFIKESSKDDSTPRSLNLQLRDSNGITFDSEIFHVSVPGLTSQREHLVGITQANADRPIENGEIRELAEWDDINNRCKTIDENPGDMRHILGYTLSHGKLGSLPGLREEQGSTESQVDSSTSSKQSKQYTRLRSLERVNCVVKMKPGEKSLLLRSLKLTFKDNNDAVPDLLQWIKPSYCQQFFEWVQSHISARTGHPKKQAPLNNIRMFSPTATAGTLVVGDSRIVAVEDIPPGDRDVKKSGIFFNVELRQLIAR